MYPPLFLPRSPLNPINPTFTLLLSCRKGFTTQHIIISNSTSPLQNNVMLITLWEAFQYLQTSLSQSSHLLFLWYSIFYIWWNLFPYSSSPCWCKHLKDSKGMHSHLYIWDLLLVLFLTPQSLFTFKSCIELMCRW